MYEINHKGGRIKNVYEHYGIETSRMADDKHFFSQIMFVYFFPVTWLLLSEIFPSTLKGRAFSISTVLNWATNLVIAFTFLDFMSKYKAIPFLNMSSTLYYSLRFQSVTIIIMHDYA